MATLKSMSPIKKFTSFMQIKNQIRSTLRKENVWTHVTPSGLLKRYLNDVEKKVLPVRGTLVRDLEDNITLLDVISLMEHFHLEVHASNNGRKLRNSPLFSTPQKRVIPEKEIGVEVFEHFFKEGEYNLFLENYEVKQSRYLARQSHKINGNFKYDRWSTFVLMLDLSLDFLKLQSPHSLLKYLVATLKQYEYSRLDVNGLYAFVLHLSIRGVARPESLIIDHRWVEQWRLRSDLERVALLQHFYSGNYYPDVVALQESYLQEVVTKTSLLRTETKLARISYVPDEKIFNPELVFYNTWWYGVHEQMTPVERHRDACGLIIIPPGQLNKSKKQEHTCNRGNNRLIYEGLLEGTIIKSDCHRCRKEEEGVAEPTGLQGIIDKSVQDSISSAGPALTKAINETISDPDTMANIEKLASTAAKPVIAEMAVKLDDLKNKTVEELRATVEPVMTESLGTFSALNGILSFLKDTMKSVTNMIPVDLLGKIGINIDMETLIHTFKYYILYINTESAFIKSALLILMLKQLGIFELLKRFGTTLMAWMKPYKFTETSTNAILAEPTSAMDWIQTIMNMLSGNAPGIAICTFVTLALTVIFKIALKPNAPLNRKEHASVHSTILDGFKNLHFIGAGMFGFERILKYLNLIGTSLTKWIATYIFGCESDDRKNEKAVSIWYGKLQYFKTEAGRAAIRVSEKTMLEAEKIQPDGLAFIHGVASDPKFLSRESAQLVQRSMKDASDIASFCYRIRAMSNFQPSMFHVQFVGKAGVGKSTMTEQLIYRLHRELAPSDQKLSYYSYNPNIDHFDGYQQQKFMIIDDLFRYNEPKHMSLLIGLITNTPVMLPMAHLDEKGIQLQSDILISSTNTPYPEVKDLFCMEAVHRRRHVLIEVYVHDDRVMDKQNSSFDKNKYKALQEQGVYKGIPSTEFPHLRFNLLKPVIKPCEDQIRTTTEDEEDHFWKSLQYYRNINSTHKFTDKEYFTTPEHTPSGMEYPCKGWTYNQLIQNICGRYAALRANEGKLTKQEKFTQVMDSFTTIDAIQHQVTETDSQFSLDKSLPLIAKQYLNASYAYGCADPLGERIYLTEEEDAENRKAVDKNRMTLGKINEIPELDDLERFGEEAIKLIEDEAQPTGLSDGDSEYFDTSDEIINDIDLIDEYFITCKPTGHKLTRVESLRRTLTTNRTKDDFSEDEQKLWDEIVEEMAEADDAELRDNMIQENLMRHHNHYQSEIAKQAAKQREKFQQEAMTRDFACRRIKYGKRDKLVMLMKDCYQNELEGLNATNCNISKKLTGDKVFEPLLDPVHFTRSLMYKDRITKLVKSGAIKPLLGNKILKFLNEAEDLRSCTLIPRTPHFSENKQGTQLMIPRSWFKRMIKVDGEWVLDVTDLQFEDPESNSNPISREPIARLLIAQPSFTLAMQQFAMLSRIQQDFLVKHNHWILKHFPDITGSVWRKTIRNIFDTIKNTTMTYLFNPLKHFWDTIVSSKIADYVKIVQHALMFVIGILCIKQVGRLFRGVSEPTSKVMHRVNTRSVPFVGKNFQPTGLLNTRNTDSQLAQTYLDRNVRFIHIVTKDGISTSCHVIHTEQFLILNRHMVEDINEEVEFIFAPTPRHTDKWSFRITPENIYVEPKSDVAIVFCRQLPMARDISRHFITEKEYLHLDSALEMIALSRFEDEAAIEIRTGGVIAEDLALSNDNLGVSSYLSRALVVKGETVCGKSGSMLIVPNKASGNKNILGIQAWRIKSYTNPEIIYQIVTYEMLDHMKYEVTKKSKYPYISQLGPVIVEPTGAPKAEALVENHIEVLGSVPDDKVVGKVGRTSFRKTPIAALMDRDGFTSPRVPAALNPWDHRLLVKDAPLKNSLNKCGRGIVGPFDMKLLARASNDIAFWIKDRLDKRVFRTDLSIEEAVTGVREDGSNPIDCRASPGIPYIWDKYPGKAPGKKSLLEINEFGYTQINDPEYPAKFEKFFASLEMGVIPHHTSYDFPKDELRPFYKALGNPEEQTPPKTRSVTCMSLDIILAWRRVTCDLIASLHRAAKGNFPFAPGMNPEGPDWGRLFNYLNKFPHVVDFDVSNWDGHMTIDLMMAVGDLLVTLLGLHPHSKTAKVIYSILTEVVFGHVQYEDMVYHKLRGLISGFPGTAEVNTLAHLILFYYYYLFIAKAHGHIHLMNVSTFMNNCHSIFYGDDVQASISSNIIEWFNGQTIARAYELHGYPVTDAAKGKDIAPFKNIMDSQFLKSSFNPISPARIDRKLDISVVYDMFYWVRAKEHPEEQFRSNLHDAFRVLHGHGEQVYEAVRNQLNGWMRELGKAPFDVYWTDFERSHVDNYYAN
ncbi:hypothetical protein 4 [Shuangao insect virus 8]|uniref:RNA-directed RNA polymerase n=1 Tax=Shuangao insect virus 8 TaxID=1923469 RepID=A0A1L3KKV7_9VIRU|nr:hypothetical protein 4 [Shuangao insect virus 8]APG77945.1 hypothetical protein 4 [Shuangao insect virus 8]